MHLPPKVAAADLNRFEQLKLVGRISLWFGCVALIGLTALLFTPSIPLDNYADAVRSLTLTQENLFWITVAGGLLLLLGTGITTWLITLYSSFRVAGPLYRFSRNLEVGAQVGEVPRIRIRSSDHLQDECQLLDNTLTHLYGYYWDLERQTEKLLAELETPEGGDPEAFNQALQEMRRLQARALVDEDL